MRRVVVTGVGMVTPLGCGAELSWRRLLAGESGARKVESFDVSDLPAKIACWTQLTFGAEAALRTVAFRACWASYSSCSAIVQRPARPDLISETDTSTRLPAGAPWGKP